MAITVHFDLHGTTPEARRVDRTLWLRIPLTDAREPALDVFLTPTTALALLTSLRTAVEGYQRLVTLEAKMTNNQPAIIHHLDGNPSNHDMDNLLIVKKEENRRE